MKVVQQWQGGEDRVETLELHCLPFVTNFELMELVERGTVIISILHRLLR